MRRVARGKVHSNGRLSDEPVPELGKASFLSARTVDPTGRHSCKENEPVKGKKAKGLSHGGDSPRFFQGLSKPIVLRKKLKKKRKGGEQVGGGVANSNPHKRNGNGPKDSGNQTESSTEKGGEGSRASKPGKIGGHGSRRREYERTRVDNEKPGAEKGGRDPN